ncbi:putative bifunctional diguanylate cyclase/phosphodiesterase [Planobispora takensis]|uniref:Uncharacterized protein n=1 Tax=Planobispora takensis TaxID=1367882 RepID=A0A8J3SWH1_9ACTN|nr:EAL domain-containing protein [Planobispora takensis]GII00061.1 hypothetical protein Pta02_20690 [Planobispora takensis]
MNVGRHERAAASRGFMAAVMAQPLPRVTAALAVFGAGWFVFNVGSPSGAPLVAWALSALCCSLAALACVRVARFPDLAAPTRMFWRHFAVTLTVAVLALASNAYDALAGPQAPTQRVSGLTTALYLTAVTVFLWALLRLPVTRRSREAWLTLGLDAGVVVLAAGLFAWYFMLRGSSELALTTGSDLTAVAIITLGGIDILAAVKLALTGTGPMDRGVLWIMGLAVLVGAGGGALMPLMQASPHITTTHLSIPIIAFLVAVAAERQLRASGTGTARRAARRRPFSLLPYAAIAATDVLLLVSTWNAGQEIRLVVAGSIALTGLVVVRQITAFYDNASLLARLDASMLELSRHEQRFRSLVQNSSDVITVTAMDGTYTYISPSFESVLGHPADFYIGRTLREFTHPQDLPILQDMRDRLARDPGLTVTCQARMRHVDGSWRWLEVVATNRVDDPSVQGIVGNTRDITETRRAQDELAHQATHDALTRLANRTLFTRRAAEALAEAGTRGVALALVDLDDFKAINDRLGHAVGDALLTVVADRLRRCVRPGDTVARLGGDEFAVLLRDASPQETCRVAGEILATLRTPISAQGHDMLVQASIGLVDGAEGMDASELLRRADVAMYAAKEQGKSRSVRYSADMDDRAAEDARLGADLLQAMLSQDQLFLLYQPVVRLPHGDIAGVEALIRWRHPERGLVSPVEFIPVAERNGMIVQLGDWVLREACRQMAEWRRLHGDGAPSRVGVNVSARQLREPAFARTVADVLAETGLRPDDLLVEITETAVFDDGPAVETVAAIQALGVAIALDDFGTGHSSLGLLRTCPVDVLKVDKLFVEEVTGTAEQAAIATSLAQIAQALGLRAVAEGVETPAQAMRLYQMGYRLAQGYHFSRPLSAEDLGGLLAAEGRDPDTWEPPALAG